MKTRLIAVASAGLIAAGLSIPAWAQSDCVKQVFHKYCLGGYVQTLLSKHKPLRTNTDKGGAVHYVFADGSEQTTVIAVQGRIETVSRLYHPGVQATFDRMEGELKGIYGAPRRLKNPGGRIVDIWDQGVWRVNLSYASARGEVMLAYRHEALQEARKSAAATPRSGSNPMGY